MLALRWQPLLQMRTGPTTRPPEAVTTGSCAVLSALISVSYLAWTCAALPRGMISKQICSSAFSWPLAVSATWIAPALVTAPAGMVGWARAVTATWLRNDGRRRS